MSQLKDKQFGEEIQNEGRCQRLIDIIANYFQCLRLFTLPKFVDIQRKLNADKACTKDLDEFKTYQFKFRNKGQDQNSKKNSQRLDQFEEQMVVRLKYAQKFSDGYKQQDQNQSNKMTRDSQEAIRKRQQKKDCKTYLKQWFFCEEVEPDEDFGRLSLDEFIRNFSSHHEFQISSQSLSMTNIDMNQSKKANHNIFQPYTIVQQDYEEYEDLQKMTLQVRKNKNSKNNKNIDNIAKLIKQEKQYKYDTNDKDLSIEDDEAKEEIVDQPVSNIQTKKRARNLRLKKAKQIQEKQQEYFYSDHAQKFFFQQNEENATVKQNQKSIIEQDNEIQLVDDKQLVDETQIVNESNQGHSLQKQHHRQNDQNKQTEQRQQSQSQQQQQQQQYQYKQAIEQQIEIFDIQKQDDELQEITIPIQKKDNKQEESYQFNGSNTESMIIKKIKISNQQQDISETNEEFIDPNMSASISPFNKSTEQQGLSIYSKDNKFKKKLQQTIHGKTEAVGGFNKKKNKKRRNQLIKVNYCNPDKPQNEEYQFEDLVPDSAFDK